MVTAGSAASTHSAAMYTGRPDPAERVGAGIVTASIVALVAWALLLSLAAAHRERVAEALTAITVVRVDPEPPRVVVPERKPSVEPEGEAAPPNVRSTPTEVVAAKPPVVLIPPPVPAATVAGSGPDASAGAAQVPGPGQGAGGIGNGRGSGGAGDGTGSGLGFETPPRRIRGRMSFSDATRVAGWENVIGREMTTRFLVEVDGRVSNCRASRSSGLPELDDEVCRLIVQRFRYEPSRDARGRPVRAGVEMDHYFDQR